VDAAGLDSVGSGGRQRSKYRDCRVEDSEIDCLFTHLARLVFHADILPRHHPYVGHLKNMYCPIICCPAGSSDTSMAAFDGASTLVGNQVEVK